jgi:peroxin-1
MPGTEVEVAPKTRKRNSDSAGDSHVGSNIREHTAKMLLRLQEPNDLCRTSTHIKGVELHVGLTSVAVVHPETAKRFSFDTLQLVSIVPRVSKENVNNSRTKSNIMKAKGGGSAVNEVENGNTDKKEHRQAVVHLLISESVAKGHVLLAKSLRLYLRASLHSCTLSYLNIHLI